MTVRTRIAPSPTGDPHVGTAYIALFNSCFARAMGGQFILRIEDTDQERSTAASEQAILDSLKWLGLEWDEGPDVPGAFGPYRQSERKAIYQQHVDELLTKGHAFTCYCSSERLNDLRKEQMESKSKIGYDGHCMHLTKEEIKEKEKNGEASVVRMKIPQEGVCEFEDLLRGKIEIEWSQVDMQILMKSDGMPTYHLANVVDDHLMEISHVIRGEEWINSAPKHQLLYKYFDWEMPVLCHLPLLRNTDKSKLSKRKNPTSINYFKKMGYLPEALINYLGRMGWSMPDESEKFSLQEMISNFDISRVTLGGPIFDLEKLTWLNGLWIREELDDQALIERVKLWALNEDNLKKLIPHVKERIEVFSDLSDLTAYFFSGRIDVSLSTYEQNKLGLDEQKKILQFSLWSLESLETWDRDVIESHLFALANAMEFKIRDFVAPLFVAISGKPSAISVIDSLSILGLDLSRARLRDGIEVTGGVSKKAAKKLDKEYTALLSTIA